MREKLIQLTGILSVFAALSMMMLVRQVQEFDKLHLVLLGYSTAVALIVVSAVLLIALGFTSWLKK